MLSKVKEKYINYIDNIIINNKVSHAYLIEIDDYDSDLSYIFSFIKMILFNMTYNKMNASDNKIIKLIDEDNYPDISIISSDSSTIKKSLILDLQKEFKNKSLYNNKKIYVIKESEKLNASSANTILKFLEEPEEDIIAILVTDNRYHVIDTIVSRCQILSLKEKIYDYVVNEDIIDFISYILNPDDFFINYNDIIKNKYSDKNVLKSVIIDVESVFLDYLSNGNNVDFNKDIRIVLDKNDNALLINIISIIEDELPKLSYNVNYKLWVDSFFSKLEVLR